ncbi:MAG: GAF domain-containing sensor histidine kinase, partial [Ardenticatenaceae bacterium]
IILQNIFTISYVLYNKFNIVLKSIIMNFVADELSLKLSTALDLEELSDLLITKLPDVLRACAAAIFFLTNEDTLSVWAYQGLDGQELPPIPLGGKLASYLCSQPFVSHLRLQQLVVSEELTAAERALLACDKIGVWLPLCFNGKPLAILLLGRKCADEFYTQEDMQMLLILARHAATTAMNAIFIQTLHSQLHEMEESKKALERMHRRLFSAREEERKALARELHDGPVQDAIGISLELRMYSRQAKSESFGTALQKLRSETLDLLGCLRHICTGLRPPDLDMLGLACAIRTYTEKEPDLSALFELDLMNDEARLPDQVAISLFRIYQEASKNIIKHAKATKVQVELHFESGRCTLTISDNGCGFEVPPRLADFANEQHFGLLGIQERADAIDAKLEITSELGRGTRLLVQVLLPANDRKGD